MSDTLLQDLLIKAQQGDTQAYQEFLEQSAKLLRPFVSKRIFNADDVEDVLQDVLVGLHKARHTYIPGRPILSWVFAIARYKLIDHIRKVSRVNKQEVVDDDAFANMWAEDIDLRLDVDVSDHLKEAMDQLSDSSKQIITMLKLEGYKIREIADALNMNESAVKTAAHRGYKLMRKYLEKRYGY